LEKNMKIIKGILLVLVLFSLSACVAAERVAVETATSPLPTETLERLPTETAVTEVTGEKTPQIDETPQDESENVVDEGIQDLDEQLVSECTLVSSLPDPTQEYAEIFSIREDDWVIGSEDAAITLIEYGDFQ
jgi:hypothetical protein